MFLRDRGMPHGVARGMLRGVARGKWTLDGARALRDGSRVGDPASAIGLVLPQVVGLSRSSRG